MPAEHVVTREAVRCGALSKGADAQDKLSAAETDGAGIIHGAGNTDVPTGSPRTTNLDKSAPILPETAHAKFVIKSPSNGVTFAWGGELVNHRGASANPHPRQR